MRKFLLIVNPVSGTKKYQNILTDTKSALKKNNIDIEIIKSKYIGHIEKIVNEYEITQINCICIIGGDGSLHEAINGLIKRKDKLKLPLALIPSGSGNSLSRDLNILKPKDAIKALIQQNKMDIDVAKINYENNKIYSFNITGWGMVANIGIKAEKYRWLGTSRYTILSLIEIFLKNTSDAKITYYDKNNKKHQIKDKFMFIVACNTVHTGKGMKIAPQAKLNDGLLDLILIKNASRIKLLQLMPKLFNGTHINSSAVEYIQIDKLKLEPIKKTKLNIDGEIKASAPFTLSLIPNAIEIIKGA